MTPEESERVNRLCERIHMEKDTRRLTALVEQLNEVLQRAHREPDSAKLKAS